MYFFRECLLLIIYCYIFRWLQYKRRAKLYVLQTYTNTSVKLSRDVRQSAHLYTFLIAAGIAFIAVVIAVALIQDDIEQGFSLNEPAQKKKHLILKVLHFFSSRIG